MLVFPIRKVIIPESVMPFLKKERSFLDRAGIKILPAASNKEALTIHRAEKADLIVAILDDGGIKGEDFCTSVRGEAELCKVSIIILCADTDADRERCLGCSANSFVTSPINMAVFLQEAHHLLNIARRTSFREPVDVELNIEADNSTFAGDSINISSSGMFIETAAELNEADVIGCTFSLPGSGKVAVEATVVRAEEGPEGMNRYGISFVEPGEDVVTAIALYARKRG